MAATLLVCSGPDPTQSARLSPSTWSVGYITEARSRKTDHISPSPGSDYHLLVTRFSHWFWASLKQAGCELALDCWRVQEVFGKTMVREQVSGKMFSDPSQYRFHAYFLAVRFSQYLRHKKNLNWPVVCCPESISAFKAVLGTT
ncbi:UNVERIFIED_CONTAM: hypothetical protein K2H54_014728 [Gekko kuhli]